MFNLVIKVLQAGRYLTAYAISRLGLKRFLMELTGFLVIEETVDFAAEHSEWVRQNKAAILAICILGGVGGTALSKLKVSSKYSKAAKGLFSKIKLRNHASAISRMAEHIRTEITSDGFKLLFNHGREYIKFGLSRDGKRLNFAHTGHPAAAMLLAGGFGAAGGVGINTLTSDTALQFKLVLADLLSSEAAARLETKFLEMPAVDLLTHGASIINSFLRDNPGFSEDRAVACLEAVKSRNETKIGQFALFAYVDEDDIVVYEVNGQAFRKEGQKLVPFSPNGSTEKEIENAEDQAIFDVLLAFYSVLSQGEVVEFYPVVDTTRYITDTVTNQGHAIALVWDEESGDVFHVIAKDSMFDSAKDNIVDVTEASAFESLRAFYEDTFGFGDGPERPETYSQMVKTEDISNQLGKF